MKTYLQARWLKAAVLLLGCCLMQAGVRAQSPQTQASHAHIPISLTSDTLKSAGEIPYTEVSARRVLRPTTFPFVCLPDGEQPCPGWLSFITARAAMALWATDGDSAACLP